MSLSAIFWAEPLAALGSGACAAALSGAASWSLVRKRYLALVSFSVMSEPGLLFHPVALELAK